MAQSAAELRPHLDAMQAAIDTVSEADLRDELIEIRRAIDRLESVFANGFRRFEAANKYAADGALSPVSWLRWMCRLSPAAAIDRLSVARQLPVLPQSAAAFARGDIGYHHVAVIARSAEDLGAETMRKREVDFLASAKEMDPGRFYTAAKELRYMLDADGALAEANRAYKRRWLEIRQMWDGVYRFEARLDPEGGALVHTAIQALSALGKGDDRSGFQRKADALVELARRQLSSGLPQVRGERPHLTVTATIDTLTQVPGHEPGKLAGSLPIPAETARRIACDSALTRAVLDGSQPLDVGRATRTIPPALRRAVVLRDQGCRFQSCDRPPEWTDGHHLQHWADGGETNRDNVLLLCRRHHRKVHEEGWRLAWGEGGAVIAIPPPGPG